MGVREDLINLLRSSQVQTINFNFPAMSASGGENIIRINHVNFQKVAYAIENNRITVTTDTQNLRQGASGQYESANQARCGRNRTPCGNTMILPNLTDIHTKALAIHESVHASFDVGRFILTNLDNESASYIAQCIYLIKSGRSFIASTSPVHVKAFEIAVLHQLYGDIDRVKLAELRAAIAQSPEYRSDINTVFRGDGV